MNFTTSQNGAELAIHEGYIYRRGGKIKNGVSWRCNEAHCKGRINILEDESKIKNEHCHDPSPDSLNARKFKKNVKERAKLSHDKPEAVRRELQIEFPWRVLLNFHCQMQPGKWSTDQSKDAFPYANAKNTD